MRAIQHAADLAAHVFRRRFGRYADEIDEQVAERTVRERLAVRRAMRVGMARIRGEPLAELVREAALPRPRWRGDRHEVGAPVAEGALRDQVQLREIVLAADERRRRGLVRLSTSLHRP